MKIKSAFKEYSMDFCRDLSLLQDLAAAKDTFFVLDRTVYEIYKDRLICRRIDSSCLKLSRKRRIWRQCSQSVSA